MLAKARYISYANNAIYHYVPNSSGLVATHLSGYEYEKIINALKPLEEMKSRFIENDLFDLYYHQIESRFINQIFQRINIINIKNIEYIDKQDLISILLQFLYLHFPNWEENPDYINNFKNYELSDVFLTINTKLLLKKYHSDKSIKTPEEIYDNYERVSARATYKKVKGLKKMIQTVRIIRDKYDDYYTFYIEEFLKSIGCMVEEFIIPDSVRNGCTLESIYDIDLIINYNEDKWNDNIYTSDNGEIYQVDNFQNILKKARKINIANEYYENDRIKKELTENDSNSKIIDDVIEAIWGNEDKEVLNELKLLGYAYSASNMFLALYNHEISYLVEDKEGYDPFEEQKKTNKCLTFMLNDLCFDKYAIYNHMLCDYEKKISEIKTVYFKYSLLFIKDKINRASEAIQNMKLFTTHSLIKKGHMVMDNNPEFIMINDLLKNISDNDFKYSYDANIYYILLRKRYNNLELPLELHHDLFLHDYIDYKKNISIEEKKYDRLIKSNEVDSIELDDRFISVKVKEEQEAKKEFDDSTKKITKDVIEKIFNVKNIKGSRAYVSYFSYANILAEYGHRPTDETIKYYNLIIQENLNYHDLFETMPIKKIYVYNALMGLGDVYHKIGEFDNACNCYLTAEKIVESNTNFYSVLTDKNSYCFEGIYKKCFQKSDIYQRLVNSASRGNKRDIIDIYLEKLEQLRGHKDIKELIKKK